MFLFGHSRGADSVLGFASRCSHVSGVIVLNAKSKVRAVSPEIAARWRTRGYWEEMDFGSGRRIPLGTDFLEEIERVETRIEHAARTLQCPLLAVHGGRDQHTPPSHSKILAEWAIRATMVLMPEADHFLTGPRPEDSELHVSRLTHYIRSFMTGD
jgi:pimeloyl-ACP methyl ester carboxylesterase